MHKEGRFCKYQNRNKKKWPQTTSLLSITSLHFFEFEVICQHQSDTLQVENVEIVFINILKMLEVEQLISRTELFGNILLDNELSTFFVVKGIQLFFQHEK